MHNGVMSVFIVKEYEMHDSKIIAVCSTKDRAASMIQLLDASNRNEHVWYSAEEHQVDYDMLLKNAA